MATLPQPLPLNHPPPPQPSSQPPRKKLRSINARPKLTLEQITDNQVVQSALRLGRRAHANPPKPGEEHQALDKLLKRMQAWAHQVAPHYSLAEFLVAAHGIAGNRELRPLLGVFRLAELRHVTAHDPNHPNKHTHNPDGQPDIPIQGTNAETRLIHADAGPGDADLAPDQDDWDELDIVPDEAIEVRSLPNPQSHSPVGKPDHQLGEKLNPDVEASIERNRLAALERRKAAMARLTTEKGDLDTNEASNPSLTKRSGEAEKGRSAANADTSSPPAPETEQPSTEVKIDEQTQPAVTKSEIEQPKHDTSHSKLTTSEKETDLSQKRKPEDESRAKTLTTVMSKDDNVKIPSEETNTSAQNKDKGAEETALQQTDLPKRAPQTTNGPEGTEKQKNQSDGDSRTTVVHKRLCEDKAELPSENNPVETTGASGRADDEEADMEILAEFQEGGEL